jgi:ATP-dependent DNA helicase DinG
MGVLVVPAGPQPKEAGWLDWASERAAEAVLAADGRTLVLCSSIASMRRLGEAVRRVWPNTRIQGEAGRSELRTWFRDDVSGVLVASRSFFQGLDIAGEACSCVVIDRAPFSVPDDPLEKAVCDLLIQRNPGGDAFSLRSLPQACMVLAQAAGRLIRSRSDRGAVVVLDNRVLWNNPMGRSLKASLPPFPVSAEVEDVRRVLSGEAMAGAVVRGGGITAARKARRAG